MRGTYGWSGWTIYVESVFAAAPGCISESINGIIADDGGSRMQAAGASLSLPPPPTLRHHRYMPRPQLASRPHKEGREVLVKLKSANPANAPEGFGFASHTS